MSVDHAGKGTAWLSFFYLGINEEMFRLYHFSLVQSLSHVRLFATPWTAACQASLSITKSQSLLRLMSLESVMPSNHLILCHPSASPPAFNLSQHQGLSQCKVSSLHQVATVLEFQLQHQSSQWIFRTGFLYNGLVGSPHSPRDSQESSPKPQFKSINSSVLSFLYSPTLMTTGKTIVFTRWTFVGKVMPLLFNMISRLEKVMAPHSNTLAWKIPWTEGPGRLQSIGSHRVGHDWSDFAAAADWS